MGGGREVGLAQREETKQATTGFLLMAKFFLALIAIAFAVLIAGLVFPGISPLADTACNVGTIAQRLH